MRLSRRLLATIRFTSTMESGDRVRQHRFRIHSAIVSFSSSRLRDMLSPYTPLNAPMPEGHPRIVFEDIAEDIAVLLKMIYTPG